MKILHSVHVCRFTHHTVFRRAVKLDSVMERCLLKAGDAQSKHGKDTSYQQILSARAFRSPGKIRTYAKICRCDT